MKNETTSGVYSSSQLQAVGCPPARVRELVAAGSLRRLKRGWFAGAEANGAAIRAILAGGRLGCLSGAVAHGLWVPPHHGLHILVGAHDRAPSGHDLTVHRTSGCLPAVAVLPVLDCLGHVIRRHDPETALVVAESAVNLQLADAADVRGLIAHAPVRKQGPLSFFELGAQSGSETRLRLFFKRRHVRVQTQVKIPGLGRVDMIAGDRLIVEADSKTYHAGSDQYAHDRRRDLEATRLGFRVLRLTWEQVWLTWESTQEVLSAMLGRRCHRRAQHNSGE